MKEVSVAKPPMVTREEWGSNPDPIPDEARHDPDIVTLHHAGVLWKEGDEAKPKLTALQSWGKSDKGWPDLPYHYLIAPDGTIYQGRPTTFQAETNTSYDLNGHIGINVWGNFEEQRISEEQLNAVIDLTAWLMAVHGIDPSTIGGHKDRAVGQTDCPGKDFYRYLEQGLIEKWLNEKLAGQEPEVKTLPPMEEGPTEVIPGGTLSGS
jgi:hypothetical protein